MRRQRRRKICKNAHEERKRCRRMRRNGGQRHNEKGQKDKKIEKGKMAKKMRKMKNNFNIVISRKPSLPKSSIIPAHWE
jgi:hypothetical protein